MITGCAFSEAFWIGKGVRRIKHMDKQREWQQTRNELVSEIRKLGFPAELGEQIAKQLAGTKAMGRMIGYLHNVKPRSAELIVDEMLAICSDIDRWRSKKESEEANMRYTRYLNSGLDEEE